MSGMTLASLVAILDGADVQVIAATDGLGANVTAPRIFDPDGARLIAQGEVVLGVNIDSSRLPALVAQATAASAAAIIVKETVADEATLRRLAGAGRVALLSAPAGATWDQLLATIRNAARHGVGTGESVDAPIRDLFALADTVAALADAAVTIEDRQSNLLAYSNLNQPIDAPRLETILGRRLPDYWANVLRDEGIFAQLVAIPQRVVRIHEPATVAKPRLATAIRAGEELLGFMWAVQGDLPLHAKAETALLDGARLAALHLLKHQAADDMSRRERGTLLRDLLNGERRVAEVATALGIAPNSPCAVAGFRLFIDDEINLSVKRARILDLITVACESFRRRVVTYAVGNTVYALFPGLDGKASQRLESLVRNIADQSRQALGEVMMVGIGGTVSGLSEARRSRDEVDQTLRALADPNSRGERVATFEEMRVACVLQSLGDHLAEHRQLRLPALDTLAEHDRVHGKSYLPTLRTFIAESFDVPAAARRLQVHPNSVRYRLRRIEEIAGLDLQDVRFLLLVGLQLMTSDPARTEEDSAADGSSISIG